MPSLRSLTIAGVNRVAGRRSAASGRNLENHTRKSADGSTRRRHSASINVGDRKSSPLGSQATARRWYLDDAGAAAWEPSGDDFLSPTLVEAECLRRLLPSAGFRLWFSRFLPEAAQRRPASLFTPARVSDRSDGKIAHLDGLNLSRAWCWRSIAASLAPDDPARPAALTAADEHLAAGLEHVAGDYMGEHWLATFALLALTA